MDLQISSLMNNITTKVDSYKSKLLSSDTLDFSNYLKDNFDNIDKDKNGLLSKDEINTSVKKSDNPEIQKILDNKNIESIISNIDKNSDDMISKKEADPDSNLGNILKSTANEFKDLGATTANLGIAAQSLTQKLCQNYYANANVTKLATSAVSYLL
ncbi:MAG: EF-hand domain-containing protein [Clostridium sp.]|nr:EF-hand domain-containing protein [Clostridium sp.]